MFSRLHLSNAFHFYGIAFLRFSFSCAYLIQSLRFFPRSQIQCIVCKVQIKRETERKYWNPIWVNLHLNAVFVNLTKILKSLTS